MSSITIIGGGNLGRAIAEGLLVSGYAQPAEITVTRRKTTKLDDLAAKGVVVTADNNAAVKQAKIVILAVKPYQIIEILKDIKDSLNADQVLVSVATGVDIATLSATIDHAASVYRAMPNTAIAIRESLTCITGNGDADKQAMVHDLFSQLGVTVHIEENLMDAATVLGACGMAYALRFIRAATQGGIEIGFDANTASLIAAQTAKGAAAMLLEGGQHPEAEIDKVTTPKGCTIVGLNEMEHRGFSSALIRGILASFNKLQD